jgi:hypothetical protein
MHIMDQLQKCRAENVPVAFDVNVRRQVAVRDLFGIRHLFSGREDKPDKRGGDPFGFVLAVLVVIPVIVEVGQLTVGELVKTHCQSVDIADDIPFEISCVI